MPLALRPDATLEEDETGELLDRYRPHYWLGGHIHNLPYVSGNVWRAQSGKTTVLIRGQVMNANFRITSSSTFIQDKPFGRRLAARKKNEIPSQRVVNGLAITKVLPGNSLSGF